MRTTLDVGRQMAWQYRVTATGVILAGFSVATALTQVPKLISALAAATGATVAFFEVRTVHKRTKALVFQPRSGDDYADLVQSEGGRGRMLRTSGNVGVALIDESRRLRQGSLKAEVDQGDFVLRDELAKWALPFLARQMRRSTLHNGSVVGLASDLPTAGGVDVVRLKRVTYYDFVCTNILSGYDVREVGFGARMYGRNLFVNRKGRLRAFADSWLANTIGVSTLAITSDGKLLLPFQTKHNVGSPELYPPSGSGALEQQDLPPSGRGQLRDVIVHGAVRELREECGVLTTEVQDSEVLGHARWFTRGAMPEFAAVTLLSAASEEVEARKVSRGERPYIEMVSSVRFTPMDQWDPDAPFTMIPHDIGVKASWPLAFALSCLADVMADQTFRLRTEITQRLAS
ncbi:hypothetical protein AB0M20_11040 [Actinoplanes sp. NPDC051633]|uniref:hypothetical protein n=1 Tax=Actinoplanes sp. NPDC051633 TaxID=3155670 RepID=UPI0034253F0A